MSPDSVATPCGTIISTSPQPSTAQHTLGLRSQISDWTQPINIRGVAPYWRVAWQQTWKNNNLEVGSYGIHMKSTPGAITGLEDGYTDWAADFQYDRTIPEFRGDVLSIRGTYIRENSSLHATSAHGSVVPPTSPQHRSGERGVPSRRQVFGYNRIVQCRRHARSFVIQFRSLTPLPVTGSANGDPRSAGYIANISWWPVQNIGLTLQYTGYTRFNGAATNYDGAGRNASSNNTLYLLARFVF